MASAAIPTFAWGELRKTQENLRLCGVLGRHLNRTLPEFKPEALLRYFQYHELFTSG